MNHSIARFQQLLDLYAALRANTELTSELKREAFDVAVSTFLSAEQPEVFIEAAAQMVAALRPALVGVPAELLPSDEPLTPVTPIGAKANRANKVRGPSAPSA